MATSSAPMVILMLAGIRRDASSSMGLPFRSRGLRRAPAGRLPERCPEFADLGVKESDERVVLEVRRSLAQAEFVKVAEASGS
jgi:hypothetical protein